MRWDNSIADLVAEEYSIKVNLAIGDKCFLLKRVVVVGKIMFTLGVRQTAHIRKIVKFVIKIMKEEKVNKVVSNFEEKN